MLCDVREGLVVDGPMDQQLVGHEFEDLTPVLGEFGLNETKELVQSVQAGRVRIAARRLQLHEPDDRSLVFDLPWDNVSAEDSPSGPWPHVTAEQGGAGESLDSIPNQQPRIQHLQKLTPILVKWIPSLFVSSKIFEVDFHTVHCC